MYGPIGEGDDAPNAINEELEALVNVIPVAPFVRLDVFSCDGE